MPFAPDKPLTLKQQRFVDEYLASEDLNATEAARKAGYTGAAAGHLAAKLMRLPQIKAAIAAAQAERAERASFKADRVLLELERVGTSDVRRLFHKDGTLVPLHELDDDTAASVASVEVVIVPSGTDADGNRIVERVLKVKLWDKNKALESAARHLGMFKDKGDSGGTVVVNLHGSDAKL